MTEINNRLQLQLQRETACRIDAKQILSKDIRKNEKKVNASGNSYGVAIMRQHLGPMIEELNRQLDAIKGCRNTVNGAERYEVLNRCLGVVFKRYKQEKRVELQDMFDPELACHIALQCSLCAVFLPDRPTLTSSRRQSTKLFDGVRPTVRQLQDEIAKQLWRQMYYKVLDANFSRWFNATHKRASGEGAAKSSPFYALDSLDRSIAGFKEYCQNDDRTEVFKFQQWTYKEYEIIGSWLLSLVKRTGLFKLVDSKKSSREKTLALSAEGKEKVDYINEIVEAYVSRPLPMLIEPLDMTADRLGGWIGDSAVLNTPTNSSWKGKVELSDLHLKFYNHQQKQAFKINPFVWDILKTLRESNQQLGKFKAYDKQRLIPMWQELDIPGYEWAQCESKKEQDDLIRNHDNFKKVCRARSNRYEEEQSKHINGQPSQYLYEMAEDCLNDEAFYIPIEPDFRSRFTCRTSYLNYQGNDVARGLLAFAEGFEIDRESKHYLSVHLANQVGLDKESYSKRIEWVENHLDVIEAVALMNSDDETFAIGCAFISEYADGDEFKFAAACREYYDLFIARTTTTTHLPCAIDATCSGQQLIAGFLKNGELAERVNVLPTTKPGDIYRDTMDRMLEFVAADEIANFRPKVTKALKGSIGRKMSKKGFISGQYGSGSKRQLLDMFEYIDNDTDIELADHEKLLIKKHWPEALEDICKIRVVFNWFKDLVEEVHANGGKEVLIPTPTGSMIHQKYPTPKTIKVTTFSFGSSDYKPSSTNCETPSKTPNLGKWKTATAANTIHGAGDASLLCLGLHDFPHSFYCVHDSISSHAGKPMSDLQKALKQAYVEVISFDIWNEIRRANGLPTDVSKLPALSNSLDVSQIMNSDYLFC